VLLYSLLFLTLIFPRRFLCERTIEMHFSVLLPFTILLFECVFVCSPFGRACPLPILLVLTTNSLHHVAGPAAAAPPRPPERLRDAPPLLRSLNRTGPAGSGPAMLC